MLCPEKLIAAKLREADERRYAPPERRPWLRRMAAARRSSSNVFLKLKLVGRPFRGASSGTRTFGSRPQTGWAS
jgi:hypothetical protein